MQANQSFSFTCFSASLAEGSPLPYNVVIPSTFSLKTVLKCMTVIRPGGIFHLRENFGLSRILLLDTPLKFSERHAFVVQATSLAGSRWKRWRKECGGGLFIMESFNEREVKALRSVIVASILFILFDSIPQHNIKIQRQTFPRTLQEVGSLCTHLCWTGAWRSV